jgi:hypothetical protein
MRPPDDAEPHLPIHHRRRLTKAFLAHFEKTEAVRHDMEPVSGSQSTHGRRASLEGVVQLCDTPASRQENGAVAKW